LLRENRLRRAYLGVAVVAVAFVVFVLFVPVIRLDTDVRPQCAMARPTPCPLAVTTPIDGHAVYWSIAAYYLGVGAYLVAFTSYGFVS
jgi:hypothetical protein